MLSAARTGAVALTAALLAGLTAGPALADATASPSPDASTASSAGAPAPAAAPASPSPVAAPTAVYGKGDPTYDGVWRQSLALTALATAKVTPATAAVDWLTGQQCADGGWPSFRAETATPCVAATEDSNATAMAVQALVALGGHQPAVDKGVQWLTSVQNADGTWSYNPGAPGDADSTGLAVSALRAAKTDPSGVAKAGKNGLDGLAALQLGCAAPTDQRGAFAYQPAATGEVAANALATSQATLAVAGGSLPVTAGSPTGPAPKALTCPDAAGATTVPKGEAAEAAAGFLAGQLATGGQHLMLTTPGAAPTPDFGATSWAVLSLVRAGHPQQAAGAVDGQYTNAAGWTKGPAGTDPSATATLLLAAHAAGRDPRAFGGTDLVKQLADAGPAAQSGVAAGSGGSSATGKKSGTSPVWTIGIGLLIGAGGGLVLSMQRKSNQVDFGPAKKKNAKGGAGGKGGTGTGTGGKGASDKPAAPAGGKASGK
ncbi:terpene cyclase/mutase family protein [Kitasatospora nipponensis]|uniref:Terpene cyclase/mutase family protein n=1 Tax=Kitasatospora nipponensis TaxID=258049 RepID=A0ABN1WQX9_9ACTN